MPFPTTGALALSLALVLPSLAAAGPVPSFAPEGDGRLYPAHANGTLTALPSLAATPLGDESVTMDGRLDDPAWGRAETGWGFQQNEPSRGGSPSVPTTFKVLYDADALYFGVACWERDMRNVSSHLDRRDNLQASDMVSIYLDPYLDRTTGYNFRISPEEVLADAYLFDNGDRDWDWNGVWEAKTTADERGWYVEVRIPFSQVRFTPRPDMTWGLQVYRWMHGRAEDTGWVTWDRNTSGFVSRWGTLTGLQGVATPRKLEVLPYVVTRHTDPADPDPATDSWKDSQNFGADLKYGITANLTLNATFQPDFGQVEADPATLNLSPFETVYAEKRPFFIEGARSFQHPDYNLFYSRRIGSGDPNSRIRGAAKLTGKIGGNVSLAVLGAATDIGVPDKAHNPFVPGTRETYYGLVRVGREFAEGNHQVYLMGTTVQRNRDSFAGVRDPRQLRNAHGGGLDFQLNFADRAYRIAGSAVGTIVDSFADRFDPAWDGDQRYGTGGTLFAGKVGGSWRGGLTGYWESEQLDPNDMGYLQAPDEKGLGGELEYSFNAEGRDGFFNWIEVELDAERSWLYAGNSGLDLATGGTAWRYGRGHGQHAALSLLTSAQHASYHQGWFYAAHYPDGTDKHATRRFEDRQGPLMTVRGWTNLAGGVTSDWRKPLSVTLEVHWDGGSSLDALATEGSVRWNQNEHLSHTLGFGVRHNRSDDQWLGNFANDGAHPGVSGIGGVDYVFAELDQMIWDVTFRSSVLLDPDRSVQLYVQPFLTRGRYSNPKWLAAPDSYDLRTYPLDAALYDFNYGAVNLNLVYRWEYRPGSTLFLVWTHNKERYDSRGGAADPDRWGNGFEAGYPFRTEPGNTLLAKFSYWFSI